MAVLWVDGEWVATHQQQRMASITQLVRNKLTHIRATHVLMMMFRTCVLTLRINGIT